MLPASSFTEIITAIFQVVLYIYIFNFDLKQRHAGYIEVLDITRIKPHIISAFDRAFCE